MRNPPGAAMIDALGNGLGYSLILLTVGAIRELLGQGSLFGFVLLTPASEGGWFHPIGLMQLAPSAFFIIGFLVWGIRSYWRSQSEPAKFPLIRERTGQ
jgi:Na+-transporting NADH:ubiquinone oxidoreductase subunit D